MENSNARFKVFTGGPLEVTGHFRLVDTGGRIIENRGAVFLCRCGNSSNKPFCDGSHKGNGFSE
ncbi:MAG: CDGSH iron-sulfur domain-containing protein [Bacteroidota bacterium]